MASATKKFFQRPAKKPNENFGKRVEIKCFYENPLFEDDSTPRWVEWAPPLIAQSKKPKWDGYGMQIYKNLKTADAVNISEKFIVSHLKILSPYIRESLRELLGKWNPEFDTPTSSSPVTIYWPFSEIYSARHRIAKCAQDSDDETHREHLELFIKLIGDELGETMDELEGLEATGEITHKLLWALFPRGSMVLSEIDGVQAAYRVIDASHIGSNFNITGRYVRFDGSRYGYLDRTLTIRPFFGKKAVSSLSTYPIEAAPSYKFVKDRLSARGRRVLDFQHIHYVRYLNKFMGLDRAGETANFAGGTADMWGDNIHIRVIVDFVHYSRRVQRTYIEDLPAYSALEGHIKSGHIESSRNSPKDDSGFKPIVGCDCSFCRSSRRKKLGKSDDAEIERLNEFEQERNKQIVLKDPDNLILMDPFLDGFSFASKEWRKLNVERISPLEPNTDAFDHLVFSKRSKELVCALVEDHKMNAKQQDDFVAGKGQGLLILLSGPPGTGKTLMAEAVTDKTNSPLYYVDTRDLDIRNLETNLETIMEDAAEWNAMLLLDEADVYISERSPSRPENETVSIFLRRLEYFKGTMFLTTNLMDQIDHALESRVQVHLRFSNLTESSRACVWRNFLARMPSSTYNITDTEIERLSKWDINGREIKNVLKMTTAWCRQAKQLMTVETLDEIISITCPRAKKVNTIAEQTLEASRVNSEAVYNKVNSVEGKASHLLEMEDLLQ